jgi:hypothetical protein
LSAPPTVEEQAREAERASRPRSEHRALEVLVGKWRTALVDVGVDGSESGSRGGSAVIEWVLGGRYLDWRATLELGGEVHETHGYLGYDLNQREYQMLMISDLASGMSVARGRGDLSGAGIKLVLEVVDPGSGAIRRAQSGLRVVGRDHFVLEQVGMDGEGNERIMRRTHYRRVR